MAEIHIVIPDTPPSVNHYVLHTRSGRHYKSSEAEAFAQLVALEAGEWRGANIEAKGINISIRLGKGQKGDIDNFAKVPIDSLVRCAVIRSDATITRLLIEKSRAKPGDGPRTDVWIYGDKEAPGK